MFPVLFPLFDIGRFNPLRYGQFISNAVHAVDIDFIVSCRHRFYGNQYLFAGIFLKVNQLPIDAFRRNIRCCCAVNRSPYIYRIPFFIVRISRNAGRYRTDINFIGCTAGNRWRSIRPYLRRHRIPLYLVAQFIHIRVGHLRLFRPGQPLLYLISSDRCLSYINSVSR